MASADVAWLQRYDDRRLLRGSLLLVVSGRRSRSERKFTLGEIDFEPGQK